MTAVIFLKTLPGKSTHFFNILVFFGIIGAADHTEMNVFEAAGTH